MIAANLQTRKVLRCSGTAHAGALQGLLLRTAAFPGRRPALWMALALAVAMPSAAKACTFRNLGAPGQQETSAVIEGAVRDPGGAAIAGALVLLKDADGAATAETKTDAAGQFSFHGEAAGTYALEVQMAGFSSLEVKTIHVRSGERKQFALTMQIAPTGEAHPEPGGETPNAANTGQGSAPAGSDKAPAKMEFDDKPNFTIAGITDWSDAGLHGSTANARTSDALNKDTLALKAEPAASAAGANKAPGSPTLEANTASAGKAAEADAHRAAGDRAEKAGDPLTAVREYEAAARLNPSEQNYFDWGTELLLHKAVIPSAEVFRKGATEHADSARLRAGLGVALYASGSYEDAAREICEASDLRPADASFYLLLGEMEKSSAGPLDCAEAKLARFAHDQPHNAQANYLYALAIWKARRGAGNSSAMRESESLLRKAVSIDSKLGEAYVQLGILHAASGKTAEAIQDFKRAIAAKAELADAHYRLSLAYKRTGANAKAQQEYEAYQRIEKTEAAERESERRNLRQFLVVMKGQEAGSAPK